VSRIAVLIPAAGASSRYGQCKQLVTLGGKSLLQHAVDLANTVAPGVVLVVTGADHQAISETIRDAVLIRNPDWKAGLGRSIACGVERLAPDYDGILILLADQIALDRGDLKRLCNGFDGGNIVCAHYGNQRGVPALFCRGSFPRLQRLTGDRGAKALLRDGQLPVKEVPMEHAAVDIDRQEDLDRWLRKSAEAG
jgi:molybdenum cofactor cytidylyltransferase